MIQSTHGFGGESILPGKLYGGEEIQLGTLHGGEEIQPGTLHGGEEIQPGTLHGGEEIQPGTLHGGEEIQPGTLHGGEEIQPGTLHGGEVIERSALCAPFAPATYRTKDGRAYYKFKYIAVSNYYEIDILEMPSYGWRNSSFHVTHRLNSSRGGYKICFNRGREPRDITTAKNYSKAWAELTHKYIQTGITIDDQIAHGSR